VLGQPLHAYARGHPGLRALVLHRLGHYTSDGRSPRGASKQKSFTGLFCT
jgi:hypothetical protein